MFSIFKRAVKKVKSFFSGIGPKVAAVTGVLLVGASAHAEEGVVTLPSTGVDIAAYATAALTNLGPTISVCIGATVAILLVRWGFSYVKGIGRAKGI